ncbi:hypothetical protein [Georgenia sp. Z1491]|uniref:hypothetical protein n=1 Tax=Georgenia sp. Z1491 TaxID=3416707 RepID=UPI003CF889A1
MTQHDPSGTSGEPEHHAPDDDAPPPAADPTARTEDLAGESDQAAESDADAPDDTSDAEPEPEPTRATTVGHVRAAPRYGRFMWTGFLLGILVSILLVVFTEGQSFGDDYADDVGGSQFFTDRLSDSNAIGLLVLTLGPLGILLGAFVAYLLDRRSLRRRERATRGLTE